MGRLLKILLNFVVTVTFVPLGTLIFSLDLPWDLERYIVTGKNNSIFIEETVMLLVGAVWMLCISVIIMIHIK